MSDRFIPFGGLGKGSGLRFDRADIKAIENALGIGYPHFTRPGIFGSLTATEVYVWRGLREENEKGELVHVFPLNDAGKEMAGDLVWEYLSSKDCGGLDTAIIDAFVAAGPWHKKAPEKPAEDTEPEELPKN